MKWKAFGALVVLAALVSVFPSCTTTHKKPTTTPTQTALPTSTPTATPTLPSLSYNATGLNVNYGAGSFSYFAAVVMNTSPTASPIPDATVVVDGAFAPWSAANNAYVINPWAYSAGTTMSVTFNVPGYNPGTGSVLLPYDVAVTTPVPNTLFGVSTPIPLGWTTSGTPNFFSIGDRTNANPTPAGVPTRVPGTQNSYTIPAGALVIIAGTPTPQASNISVAGVNQAEILGSVEAAQAIPTPNIQGIDAGVVRVQLNP